MSGPGCHGRSATGEKTGIAAADFSRIRRVKIDRFTIDRLMAILNKLDRRVDVSVSIVSVSIVSDNHGVRF